MNEGNDFKSFSIIEETDMMEWAAAHHPKNSIEEESNYRLEMFIFTFLQQTPIKDNEECFTHKGKLVN